MSLTERQGNIKVQLNTVVAVFVRANYLVYPDLYKDSKDESKMTRKVGFGSNVSQKMRTVTEIGGVSGRIFFKILPYLFLF